MSSYTNLKDFLNVTTIQKAKKVPAFLDNLFEKLDFHIGNGGRVLVLTLTKKSSEEITNFLVARGYKAFYLHSEIETLKRWDIIQKLRNGDIDILVGINLLREGIDLPEVSFIALLDADKEGFLRSKTSLIQIIGRAARNPKGEVALYADAFTGSIVEALRETHRRRSLQIEFNKKNNITPKVAISNIKHIESVKTGEDLTQDFRGLNLNKNEKKLKRMTKKEKEMILKDLKGQLDAAIAIWDFEHATVLRDQIKELTGD